MMEELFDEMLALIHAGQLKGGKLFTDLSLKVADGLFDQWRGNYPRKVRYDLPDNNYMAVIQNNVFAFASAKTYAQMQELKGMVMENGKIIPFTKFREKAMAVNARYNESFLQAERQAVIRGATMGGKWMEIEESKRLFPYLQYRTEGDSRVREEHQRLNGICLPVDDAFWSSFFPPNGWRCRCGVRRVSKRMVKNGHVKLSDSDIAGKAGAKGVPDAYWHKNVGKAVLFEEDKHPYFRAVPGGKVQELHAVKNYNLRTGKKIYADPNKLAKYQGGIDSEADFRKWKKEMTDRYGKKVKDGFVLESRTGNAILFDDTFLKHPFNSQHRRDQERWRYYNELESVIHSPDEVWSYKKGVRGKADTLSFSFIRYYQDKPMLVICEEVDGKIVAQTMHKWDKDLEAITEKRKGVLLYRKK